MRTYDADQLPRIRRELLDWQRTQGAFWMHQMIAVGQQSILPNAATQAEQARVLATEEAGRLEAAELFYAGADVVDLVSAAAPSMPLFAPRPWDFPAPAGMILFGKPLVSRPIYDHERELAKNLGLDTRVMGDGEYQVVAAVWGPWSPQTADPAWLRGSKPGAVRQWEPAGGIWMTFYTARQDLADLAHLKPAARARLAAMTGPLNQENEVAFALQPEPGEVPEGFTAEDYLIPDTEGSVTPWARAALAVFQLMRQERITERSSQHVPRAEQKRYTRAGLIPPGKVHLVKLRGRAARGTATPGASGRGLSVRFPVGPFWRNQWFPSQQVHRPILIAQFFKGPEDAPFVGADRVRIIAAPPPEQP